MKTSLRAACLKPNLHPRRAATRARPRPADKIEKESRRGGSALELLRDKVIVLGITGSIAAYKAGDLASRLTQAGAAVDAVMTAEATKFITPLALRGLTRRPVFVDMFDENTELAEQH